MLEAEQERQEDGNFIVQAVEWCFIFFVFAIQGPYVGCDEVEVVLFVIWSIENISSEERTNIIAEPTFAAGEVML